MGEKSQSSSRKDETTAAEEGKQEKGEPSKAQSVKIPVEKTQSSRRDREEHRTEEQQQIAQQLEEIHRQVAELKQQQPQRCNPGVVGLGAFGLVTLLLQCMNAGFMKGHGTVTWVGLFFGGFVQWVAGILEFTVGNTFGYLAFTAYGAFWMGLTLMWIGNGYHFFEPVNDSYGVMTGWLLLVWGLFTLCMTIAAFAQAPLALFITFLFLLNGFWMLGIRHMLRDGTLAFRVLEKIAAWGLYICASLAWYNMINILYGAVLPCKNPIPVGPTPLEIVKKLRARKKRNNTKL